MLNSVTYTNFKEEMWNCDYYHSVLSYHVVILCRKDSSANWFFKDLKDLVTFEHGKLLTVPSVQFDELVYDKKPLKVLSIKFRTFFV